MSMLTPPGMGGKYRVTGAAYPRMSRPRRRRRIVFALLGSVLALALLGYGALQLIDVFRGNGGKKTVAAGKDCPTGSPSKAGPASAVSARPATPAAAVTLPKPAEITVNVYNATPRAGLAKLVGDELKKRGFTIGQVGNAPAAFDKKVPGIGILLGAPTTDKAAYSVLGTQLTGVTLQNDTREGTDIDLILGNTFKELNTKADADKALATLAHPVPAPAKTC
ncbi:LytR C-terminal domain-containing protein [Streptomyces sp. NPDC054949]|uniref:LytR C-terminal domain-containing protein n=2 Tax=Streptomyces TaxID=1883 RepID=UPI00224F9F6C|nr:LytR C-terminal domain-containing protein [Streptomyces sp. NBC_00424]MCX5074348.1 LytR C-terminal domain-containing protein [Streptomyces sp. NBC_00424]WUD42460.1 LytR C-terminal domain-containing protein [Streptomyces sp. NBC_00513]